MNLQEISPVKLGEPHSLMAPLEAGAVVVRVREDGRLVADSVTIGREFGRQHKNVLAALDGLIDRGRINGLDFKPVEYRDAKGEMRRMIELTERGALIAMPFIGGRKSEEGQVRLVDAFTAMREELRRQKAAQPASPLAALPDFTDPAASAEAWAQQYRGRAVAETERNQLRLEIAERAKDSEFVAAYVDADGLLGIRETCQALDIENERDFTYFLENALRCMYRVRGTKLVPRASHRHMKRFQVKTGINYSTNQAFSNAMITAKGVAWLAGEWAKFNLDREAYIALHAPKAGEVDEELDEATRDAELRRAERDAARGGK